MLVLTRQPGESLELICDDGNGKMGRIIRVTISSVTGNRKVRVGVEAPKSVQVWRSEIVASGRIYKPVGGAKND